MVVEEEQCTQQIVDQCYNSYVTTYKDVVKEKCEEVFVKTCRIVLRDRAFNATTRVCKRPLVKECDDYLPSYSNSYGAPAETPEPQIVCRNLYETQCNTTHQVGGLLGGTRNEHVVFGANLSCNLILNEDVFICIHKSVRF